MTRYTLPTPWSKLGLTVGTDLTEGVIPFGSSQAVRDAYFNNIAQPDAEYLVNKVGIQYFRMGGSGIRYINANNLADMHRLVQIYLDLGANVQYILGLGQLTDHGVMQAS